MLPMLADLRRESNYAARFDAERTWPRPAIIAHLHFQIIARYAKQRTLP
jgi:hypothetical protein